MSTPTAPPVAPHPVAPVVAFRPTAPDADWETVRARLMATLAATAPGAWSDHNPIDPGVTLTEAIALGLADLHHRTAAHGSLAWPLEVPAWRPDGDRHWHTTLPVGATSGLADVLAAPAPVGGRSTAATLEPLVRSCASPGDALALLSRPPWAGVLTAEQAPVAIALLRAPRVRQVALELTDLVVAAVEAERATGDPVAVRDARAAAALAVAVPLWPSELTALVRRERRRRTAQALLERLADVVAASTPARVAAAQAELTAQGLDPQEVDVAMAAAPVPLGVLPEDLEEADGSTRVWPPHRIQALTCEPVTAADYARRARAHAGVGRAWAVPGRLAGGVGWDGQPVITTETRAGTVTLVVERTGEGHPAPDHDFLRDVLATAIGSEVVQPHPTWRDTLDPLDPRRLVCDEVGAVALARCPVVLQGRLVTGVGVDRGATIGAALGRVAAFFAAGRTAADRPDGDVVAVDGPWPRVDQPGGGWVPGEAVRFSEVVAVVLEDPAVLGVEDLSIRVGTGPFVPASAGEVALDPHCVPHLADLQCLRVRLVLTGECSGA